MSLFHNIEQGFAPEKLKLIVEISEGDYNKYEYNHEDGVLEVDRVLHGPTFYPINYCDIPKTWNKGDSDPLDAVLFSTAPIVPGAMAKGRVVGMLNMIDNEEEDQKIICVNDTDPRYDHIDSIEDLPEHDLKDIKTFFELYKIPQTGKDSVELGDYFDKKEAYKLIKNSLHAYEDKFNK